MRDSIVEGSRRRPTCRLVAWYAGARRQDGEMVLRRLGGRDHPLLRKVLIDTTTAEALPDIVRSGALLRVMARTAKASGRSLGRVLLGEPEDYDDYVMFSPPSATGGEMVAHSQRLGRLWEPSEVGSYVPGVRLYFDRRNLEMLPGTTFDGVHVLKVLGKVELDDRLSAVASADPEVLRNCISLGVRLLCAKARNPQDYVSESNRLLTDEMAGRQCWRVCSQPMAVGRSLRSH